VIVPLEPLLLASEKVGYPVSRPTKKHTYLPSRISYHSRSFLHCSPLAIGHLSREFPFQLSNQNSSYTQSSADHDRIKQFNRHITETDPRQLQTPNPPPRTKHPDYQEQVDRWSVAFRPFLTKLQPFEVVIFKCNPTYQERLYFSTYLRYRPATTCLGSLRRR